MRRTDVPIAKGTESRLTANTFCRVGIFDSGEGGLITLKRWRRTHPNADAVFFADRANAPYGTKTKSELSELVKNDIKLLSEHGCNIILMACCTACSVYGELSEDMRLKAIPIIDKTAKDAARATKNGKIAVIGTLRTVENKTFSSALSKIDVGIDTAEFEAQELVKFIESEVSDERPGAECFGYIAELARGIKACGADTLILGCTHFEKLKIGISRHLPNVRIISSAECGATALGDRMSCLPHADRGHGETLYISPNGKR